MSELAVVPIANRALLRAGWQARGVRSLEDQFTCRGSRSCNCANCDSNRGDPTLERADGINGMDPALPARVTISRPLLRGRTVMQIVRIGLDLAKYVFEMHGVDAQDKMVVRKTLRRHAVSTFFADLPPCLVGMGGFERRTLLGEGAFRPRSRRPTAARSASASARSKGSAR
jgi:hypothetical protein